MKSLEAQDHPLSVFSTCPQHIQVPGTPSSIGSVKPPSCQNRFLNLHRRKHRPSPFQVPQTGFSKLRAAVTSPINPAMITGSTASSGSVRYGASWGHSARDHSGVSSRAHQCRRLL